MDKFGKQIAFSIIIGTFGCLLIILYQANWSIIGMIEQSIFLRSDRPFVPGVPVDAYPEPLVMSHYFGDLLHIWLFETQLGIPPYFGASALLFGVAARVMDYPLFFLVFLTVTFLSLILAFIQLKNLALSIANRASLSTLVSLTLLLSWPLIFAFDRGQVHLLQTYLWLPGAVLIFSFGDIKPQRLERLSYILLFCSLGVSLSFKLYPATILFIFLLSSRRQTFPLWKLVPASFISAVIAPSLMRDEGILYLFPSGQAAGQYSNIDYYLGIRPFNFSLFVVFSDQFPQFVDIFLKYQVPLALLLGCFFGLASVLQFHSEELQNSPHVSSSFLLAVGTSICIPIASPYVLSAFLLPLTIAIFERTNGFQAQGVDISRRSSSIFSYFSFLELLSIGLSIFAVLPTQITLPSAPNDGKFLGASIFPYAVVALSVAHLAKLLCRKLSYSRISMPYSQ